MNTSDVHPVEKWIGIEKENEGILVESAHEILFRISHQLAHQERPDKVFQCLTRGLIDIPIISDVLLLDRDGLIITSSDGVFSKLAIPQSMRLEGLKNQLKPQSFNTPLLLKSESGRENHLPKNIRKMLYKIGCASFAIFPVNLRGHLSAIIFVGSKSEGGLNLTTVKAISNLVEITSKALEKIQTSDDMRQRITELRTIIAFRKEIFSLREPVRLYEKICQHINNLLGMVESQIVSYDSVDQHITVLHKHPNPNLESFPSASYPLGKDPISLIIRTGQPLMLLEDVENQAAELGIYFQDQTPKSWMGIPLSLDKETIGALTVQDMLQEHRFNTNDMNLLTSTATEVAIAIRNVHLRMKTQHKLLNDHHTTDIISKVWASTNIETILRTTIRELTRSLGATEGVITLEIEE